MGYWRMEDCDFERRSELLRSTSISQIEEAGPFIMEEEKERMINGGGELKVIVLETKGGEHSKKGEY